MTADHLTIATLAFVVFSEMKSPLKGSRAWLAGLVLCTAVGQLLLWVLGR